jgi:membrane protein
MVSLNSLRTTPAGLRTELLVERIRALEVLDRAYTLAAQTFVALLPLILVLAGMLSSQGQESVVADGLIERLGLVGAGAAATRDLIVIHQTGIYWLGALIILFSAFSLSRRLGRAYNAIWRTPPLRPAEQWRGLVWIALQVTLVVVVTELRAVAKTSGNLAALALVVVVLVVWFLGELVIQRMFTRGAVTRSRLALAAAFVTAGRLGIIIWGGLYLAPALSRQAESYGPIGVVFGLFTSLFASWLAILGGTLLAAVLTEPMDPDSGGPELPGGGSERLAAAEESQST